MALIGGSDFDGCRSYEEVVGIGAYKSPIITLFAVTSGNMYLTAEGTLTSYPQSAYLYNSLREVDDFIKKYGLNNYKVVSLRFVYVDSENI